MAIEPSPQPQYYKLTRGADKLQVDSAIRDGTGKKIDTHYQKKLTAGTGISITDDVISATVSKISIGLGNCDNTSDLNKPISNAVQSALDGKQNTGDYVRHLVKARNTSDVNYGTSATDIPVNTLDIQINNNFCSISSSKLKITKTGKYRIVINGYVLPSDTGRCSVGLTVNNSSDFGYGSIYGPGNTRESVSFETFLTLSANDVICMHAWGDSSGTIFTNTNTTFICVEYLSA